MGAPRSGKTFLVNKLADKFGYKALFEGGAEDFPNFIKEDIKNNTNAVRRILWFRNRQMNNFLDAVDLKNNNQGSVLDTFWIDNQMYIDVLLKGVDWEIVNGLAMTDQRSALWPDVILYLKNSEERTRKFIELGGRNFDSSEDVYNEQILPLQKKYEEILAIAPPSIKIVVVDRSNLDFEKEEHLEDLISKIS